MRVCVLTPVLDAFKGGNHLPLLGEAAPVQFTILTNRMRPREATLPANVRVEILPARIGPYYFGVADALFARSVLRRYPPEHPFWKQFDVLHLNQTCGPHLRKLAETGRPLCLLIHHPVSVDRFLALAHARWPVTWLWRMKYALLLRWQRAFCRSGIAIATVSRTAAARIASDYGCESSMVRIVPNGVNCELYRPGDLSHVEYDVIALGSFLHPRKGFPFLLRAYQALSAQGYRIADVGRRSDEQLAALTAIPNVHVQGMVGPEELLSLLQRSATLISTSLYEGFGLSLIEALACGRPAFAFDGGAVREVLSPVDGELVVPAGDTDALVARVQSFLHLSPEERRSRGTQYREKVCAFYPLSKSAQALRALYEDLCRT
ncbi:MAG: glycosyltransferase family 4 protein [Candidatus Peribacteraceae bacterium]|nr:glycosyltransferase family 4 protein [Candidatus Peribacteraceae bacterium]